MNPLHLGCTTGITALLHSTHTTGPEENEIINGKSHCQTDGRCVNILHTQIHYTPRHFTIEIYAIARAKRTIQTILSKQSILPKK